MYDELVVKVNNIQTVDTSCLVKKVDCNKENVEIEKRINYHDKRVITTKFNDLTKRNFS